VRRWTRSARSAPRRITRTGCSVLSPMAPRLRHLARQRHVTADACGASTQALRHQPWRLRAASEPSSRTVGQHRSPALGPMRWRRFMLTTTRTSRATARRMRGSAAHRAAVPVEDDHNARVPPSAVPARFTWRRVGRQLVLVDRCGRHAARSSRAGSLVDESSCESTGRDGAPQDSTSAKSLSMRVARVTPRGDSDPQNTACCAQVGPLAAARSHRATPGATPPLSGRASRMRTTRRGTPHLASTA
jgi:hypothetical protein